MFRRTDYSFPISILISSLHIGCCILPLFSIAVGSSAFFQGLNQYKTLLTTFQLLLLLYILVNLLSHYAGIRSFHGKRSLFMAHLSLVVVLSGLFIGYAEPFKTENQRLAEAQFRLFQTHRQVTLQIAGDYDQTILRDILCSVNGVKSTRISFDENEVQLAYSSELTSKQEIVSQLKSKGYDVSFAVK